MTTPSADGTENITSLKKKKKTQKTGSATVEDVPVLQRSPVRDAVADDLVDRRAARFGKVVVVERGGVAVPRCAGLGEKSKACWVKRLPRNIGLGEVPLGLRLRFFFVFWRRSAATRVRSERLSQYFRRAN